MVFRTEELYKAISLNDHDSLIMTLDKITKDLGTDFQYRINQLAIYFDGKEYKRSRFGIKIIIDDFNSLNSYTNDIESELRKSQKEKKLYKFTLDADAMLFLDDSSLKPYKMKRTKFRHLLVYNLAKSKKPISTKNLAEGFTKKTEVIRRTVDKIRTEISTKFTVPRDALIKNNDDGYHIDNVMLNVPKGYTP